MQNRLLGRGILLATLALSGCGGGETEQAYHTTPPGGATNPLIPGMPLFAPTLPVATPGPSPSPSPSATPGPTPTPGPSPTATPAAPTPTPPPASTPTPTPTPPSTDSCTLPSLPNHSNCHEENPHYNADVEAAVRQIREERPNLFEPNNPKKVKPQHYDTYVLGVAEILRSYGYCAAQGGPEDEVAVKKNNNFNDQYDVLMGDGTSWVAYTVTCRPPRF